MSDIRGDAFFGVECSLLGRRWQARLDPAGEARAAAIAQANGLDHVLARVLAGRGVGASDAQSYLNPTLREFMPEPLTLRDMDRAVERFAAAIKAREQIAIFGDYDVDGACSAALLAQYLTAAGAPPPHIHIPDRILEGYGPNVAAIRELPPEGHACSPRWTAARPASRRWTRPARSESRPSCSTITKRRNSYPQRSSLIPTVRTTFRGKGGSARRAWSFWPLRR